MGNSAFGTDDEFIGTNGTGMLEIGDGRDITYGPFDFPSAVMTLLSEDYFFFMKDEIAWDGSSHAIKGIQFNAARQADFEVFRNRYTDFDDVQDAANYLMSFLLEVEKDEELRVPRSAVSSALHKAMREGDLTGLTLANLAACSKAFVVGRVADSHNGGLYTVMYDSSLAQGVPAFFTYVLRLIWDLRGCTNSMCEKPFACMFVGMRNFDFERAFLNGLVEEVPGACKCPLFVEVKQRPGVGAEAAREFLREAEGSTDSGDEPGQGNAAAERARLKGKVEACQHDVNEKRKRCEDAKAEYRKKAGEN